MVAANVGEVSEHGPGVDLSLSIAAPFLLVPSLVGIATPWLGVRGLRRHGTPTWPYGLGGCRGQWGCRPG